MELFCLSTVFGWLQLEDLDSLLCCPHCNLLHYCSPECQEEHWVKVHKRHCSSLASSVVPGYRHKEEECFQCLTVAGQGGPEAVSNQQSPVYPCILKSLEGASKSLFSHHPFPLNGDPEDRIERLVILIKKLLLKMALSNHKVMQTCSMKIVQMISVMDLNRQMIWRLRKTKPCPGAAVSTSGNLKLGDDIWKDLLHHSLAEDEFALSDDPFRIFDTCAILYNVLEELLGPITLQRDSRVALKGDMQFLLTKAQNSTFLVTVDRLLDALEHQLIPYPAVVKIICFGEVEKHCSMCDRSVTVSEVRQKKPRLDRVACLFNTINMGMARCASPMCDLLLDQHPSRADFTKWYAMVNMAFEKYKVNVCHSCFKFSSHEVVHRCGHCLTKVYCSKMCQTKDWNLIHRKICRGKGPQRKVKGKAKERKELGDAMLQERMQEVRGGQLEDAFEDGWPDPFGFFQYQEMIEDMMARL